MVLVLFGLLDILVAFIGVLGHFGVISSGVLALGSLVLFAKGILFYSDFITKVDIFIGIYFLAVAFLGLSTPLIFVTFIFLFQKGILSLFN